MQSIDDVRASSMAHLRPASPEEQEMFKGGGGADLWDSQRTALDIVSQGRDKASTTDAQKSAAIVTAPNAGKAVKDPGGVSADLHKAGLSLEALNSVRGKAGDNRILSGNEVPKWTVGLKELSEKAAKGDEKAINELSRFNEHYSNGNQPGVMQKATMAQYYLYIAGGGEGPATSLSDPQQQIDEYLKTFR
jgi:hypothetical protein